MDRNGDMLRRIIVLLFSLARLAEWAAGQPRPVRYLLLTILYPAERAGRRVVAGEARWLRTAPWLAAPGQGNHPDDAIMLGVCFRLLALALVNLAMLAKRVTFQGMRSPVRPAAGLDAARWLLLAYEPAIIDTS